MVWLHWIYHTTEISIHKMYHQSKSNTSLWQSSLFFKPATDLVAKLERTYNLKCNSNINFLLEPNILKFKSLCRKAIFILLNNDWVPSIMVLTHIYG